MSDVTLSIAGRRYTLACAEGEERHIARLGREIDARITGLAQASRRSEAQTLLYAALLLADELHDLRSDEGDTPPQGDISAIADPLEKLAARLEAVADELEEAQASA